MKVLLLGAATVLMTALSPAQRPLIPAMDDLVDTTTTALARREFAERHWQENVVQPLSGHVDLEKWPGAFWAAGLLNRTGDPLLREAMSKALAAIPRIEDERFREAILREAYAMFPGEFTNELSALLPLLPHDKHFAIAAYAILQAPEHDATSQILLGVMKDRFPDWQERPRLVALEHTLMNEAEFELAERPDLSSLLAAPIVPGHPVVFSFHRHNRRHPGLAILRKADGTFLRREDGSLWSIPHLAFARTNLPGTISMGNTPQGLHTVRGTGKAGNRWIGPTPYLHSKIPYEAKLSEYTQQPEDADAAWSLEGYLKLLPQEWAGYWPMREAYLAGEAGRTEMLMHGMTPDPSWYADKPHYPFAPSAGCLTATELWNPESGALEYSDQLALLHAFLQVGKNGYLLVVELDDQEAPVNVAEVLPAVLAAEK